MNPVIVRIPPSKNTKSKTAPSTARSFRLPLHRLGRSRREDTWGRGELRSRGSELGGIGGVGGVSEFIDPGSTGVQGQALQVLEQLHSGGQIAEPDAIHVRLGVV